MQLDMHDRRDTKSKILLDEKSRKTISLLFRRGVFGSDIMSSGIYLARFLFARKRIYSGKIVLDLGCGAGTQGTIMAKNGASFVTFVDLSPKAVENARENISRHKIAKKSEAFVSDLFSGIPKGRKFDVIVFNHPFFPGEPEDLKHRSADAMLKRSMLGGTNLIKKFFGQCRDYMNEDSVIVMPIFHFAGPENDPANHVAKYGLKIREKVPVDSKKGLQKGAFSIYVISKK